ncbi:hypothetical protein [uncultured Methylobacterium sp.]|uniref:hypothetical protein n=1 Tax=uncultured Methylobacterium sp. TaxID=157278 RepID=UPI0035CA0FC5
MTTDLEAFRRSLAVDAPPATFVPALAALWWAARGGWERAHVLVQDEDGPEAAWVHAHLHRVEGDRDNAAYWYARAGRPATDAPLAEERDAIAAVLLRADG